MYLYLLIKKKKKKPWGPKELDTTEQVNWI